MQVLFEFGPCGAIPVHLHPRAVEFTHVKTGVVVIGIILDDAGGTYEDRYQAGETALIPQAALHFVENRSCQNASFIATLSSSDPGTSFITEYYQFSDQAIRSTLGYGMTPELIAAIRNVINDPRNRAPTADPACLQRCGVNQG